MILDPGLDLNLRPMRYPQFWDMYKDSIKNTWTVEEINFTSDLVDLRDKIPESERHMINRLVAFFATGDSIVSNNIALTLYAHINSPEARMYLSRQIAEEAVHIEGYLTLLDTYIPEEDKRAEAFKAVETIPSIRKKADFCDKWFDAVPARLETNDDRRKFLRNMIAYSAGVEGLAFFSAFAYVFFLRDKGLLTGLADLTNYIFADETMHMEFGFEVISIIKAEYPELWTEEFQASIYEMIDEAIDCELEFARDVLSQGVTGLPIEEMEQYLKTVGDQRLRDVGLPAVYNARNPFSFMETQGMQGLSNFFERTVTEYQQGISGEVSFDSDF